MFNLLKRLKYRYKQWKVFRLFLYKEIDVYCPACKCIVYEKFGNSQYSKIVCDPKINLNPRCGLCGFELRIQGVFGYPIKYQYKLLNQETMG